MVSGSERQGSQDRGPGLSAAQGGNGAGSESALQRLPEACRPGGGRLGPLGGRSSQGAEGPRCHGQQYRSSAPRTTQGGNARPPGGDPGRAAAGTPNPPPLR